MSALFKLAGTVTSLIVLSTGCMAVAFGETKIPVIYCSDLFHPHDDPDDHFDLACMYAIAEFDIKAIILDQGAKQRQKPGKVPISQMNDLTGRTVPCAVGLADALAAPDDDGGNQAREYQAGVETILSILRESPEPVTLFAVGSLRDVATAYNRAPELFRRKMARLYAFIGDARGAFQEYNVGLDVNAYRCIMNAGLPVYWTPCFDGGLWENRGHASYWKAGHDVLLAEVSEPILNFFIYMLLEKHAEDPLTALFQKPDPAEREKVLGEMRNLWCCAVFPHAAGRKYVLRSGTCLAVPPSAVRPEDQAVEPFSYAPVMVHVDDGGVEHCGDPVGKEIQCFHVKDPDKYAERMTSVTRHLLQDLSGIIRRP